MKAIVYTKYGSPDVLRLVDIEKPIPKDNELLIQVHATTVNRTDCAQQGESLFLRKLVLGIPAQASGKNLTRPLMPSAPQPSCVHATSPHHRKLGAGFVALPQMTGRRFGMPFILSPPTLTLRFRQNNGPTPTGDYQPSRSLSMAGSVRAKPFIMRFFTGIFKPRRIILGTAFSGKVKAVGKEVTSFQIGDNVFGLDDDGLSSHAEYMTLSANKAVTKIPANVNYEQAAASTEGAHYAYNFINKVNIERDQLVLVNGATGAIGSAAVQLLKYFGADVVAVCNTENIELVKSLRAKKVIDYMKEDFTRNNQKYDFIFDAVGKSTFTKCKPLLKWGCVHFFRTRGNGSKHFLCANYPNIWQQNCKVSHSYRY